MSSETSEYFVGPTPPGEEGGEGREEEIFTYSETSDKGHFE